MIRGKIGERVEAGSDLLSQWVCVTGMGLHPGDPYCPTEILSSTPARYCPVYEVGSAATCSGVPRVMT